MLQCTDGILFFLYMKLLMPAPVEDIYLLSIHNHRAINKLREHIQMEIIKVYYKYYKDTLAADMFELIYWTIGEVLRW